jgi:hypothetical protein
MCVAAGDRQDRHTRAADALFAVTGDTPGTPLANTYARTEVEGGAIPTASLSGEDVPMSVLLAADTGDDIDFEPERLPLTARTPEL